MADYVPKTEGQLGPWLGNMDDKLPVHAGTVGMTPTEQADLSAAIVAAAEAIDNKQVVKSECQAAIAAADTQIATAISMIRAHARRIKAHTGYTPEIGEELGIVAPVTPLDPDAIKPVLAGEVFPGKVVIRFKKNGAQSVKIFCRKVGEVDWKLCARDFNSPYEDESPLTTANVPEAREYCARGMINDHEVGQLSDPIVVVYAG